MTPLASTRRFWENRASALAWQINIAAWLAVAAPATFFVASAFAVVMYGMRRAESPLSLVWLSLSAALVAAAVGAWWRARRQFFDRTDARVLLESRLRLDTRLTAADLGLVAWPAEPLDVPCVVQWRRRGLLAWMAAAVGLVVLAAWMPIPRKVDVAHASGPPPALLQTQEMLAALKEVNIAEPQAIEQLEDRARELARRPTDEQYTHSALEAADALQNQTSVSAEALARALDSAANALRSASEGGPDMTGPAGQLAAALSGLRDGVLPANKDLLANLPASANELKNLTAQQQQQLAQQVAKAAKSLRGVTGAKGAGVQVAQADGEGVVFGSGGTGGGGESGPLMLSAQPSEAGDGTAQALTAGDLKRFSLGDKLGTSTGAHDVDPSKAVGPSSGGAIAAPASGGEAVWVNRLTPTERAALKSFFK